MEKRRDSEFFNEVDGVVHEQVDIEIAQQYFGVVAAQAHA